MLGLGFEVAKSYLPQISISCNIFPFVRDKRLKPIDERADLLMVCDDEFTAHVDKAYFSFFNRARNNLRLHAWTIPRGARGLRTSRWDVDVVHEAEKHGNVFKSRFIPLLN